MSSRCQTSTKYFQIPPPGRVPVTAFIDIFSSIPIDHKKNSDLPAFFLNIPSMGLDFKDSFGPGQNLAYLFRPLTPLNISKGVDVIGGWKIGK